MATINPMAETDPSVTHLLAKIERWREDDRQGYDVSIGLLCDAEAALRSCEARITALEAERDDARKDASYHADCRPNRRQAEAWRDDAKAMNDKWADERKRAEAAEARITDLEQQLVSAARNETALRRQVVELVAARDHQTTSLREALYNLVSYHESYYLGLGQCVCEPHKVARELLVVLAAPGPEPVAPPDRTPEATEDPDAKV